MKIFSEIFAWSKAQGNFLIDFRTPTNIPNLSYGVWTDARFIIDTTPSGNLNTFYTYKGNMCHIGKLVVKNAMGGKEDVGDEMRI